MKWSWKIGEFAGIGVFVHVTFVLLLLYALVGPMLEGESLAAGLEWVAFIIALFACVVAHEFGHALVAKRFGVKTRDIILLPIGGMARIESVPREPKEELQMALAGPMVSVVIAILLFAGVALSGTWQPLLTIDQADGGMGFFQRLAFINVFLALFNILPAFPMDGGRVLRSLLAMRMDYVRATRIAASIGQALAIGFGLIGLWYNPFLIIIAVFVWIGASQEANSVQMQTVFKDIQVNQAMLRQFTTFSPQDTLDRAVEELLAGSQQDFPVVWNHQVMGVLTRSDLIAALAKQEINSRVADVMRREFPVAEAAESLETAIQRLQASDSPILLVLQQGNLVGLLTMENAAEFFMVRSVLTTKRSF